MFQDPCPIFHHNPTEILKQVQNDNICVRIASVRVRDDSVCIRGDSIYIRDDSICFSGDIISMHIIKKIQNVYFKTKSFALIVIGSFFIASGWNWYHLAKRPHWRFALITLGMTAGLVVGFIVFKKAYRFAVRRWKRHAFWQTDFFAALDSLFFIFSLNFLVFFSRVEILSLFIVSITIALFFLRLHKFLAKHPNSSEWQGVNKMIFVLENIKW
ncbi:MAG: hypothetical protein ABII98_03135 [bacterium]